MSSVAALELVLSTKYQELVSRRLEKAYPARVLFGSKRYPIELRQRWRAGMRSNITGKNTRAENNFFTRPQVSKRSVEIFLAN
eukprot:9456264-Pyramimonas_sp.AAC.1